VSYGTNRDEAVKRAHEQFRWFGFGWKVNADLPNPESFHSAAQYVEPGHVEDQLPCGDDVAEYVEKIQPFLDAGFTEVALVQIGEDQQEGFIEWAEGELLPALRSI